MTARLTEEQHARALALNLPGGLAWTPKWIEDSNLYRLLRGFVPTFRKLDSTLNHFVEQSIPTTTNLYLDEWEEALGIPDACFDVSEDDDIRRRNIRIKLSTLAGVATEEDFVALAAEFGLTVTVNSGIEHVSTGDGGYGTKFPVLDIPTDFADVDEARMTMVVVEDLPGGAQFEFNYPIPFGTAAQGEMRCLFTKLKPANVQILFVEAP